VASQHPPSPDAARALKRLGRLSLLGLSLDGLVQAVVDLTKTVMPGDPEASVSLLDTDRPSTVAATGGLATDLDATQYARGSGPCLHAARTGELTEIGDTRTDARWPDYTPRAAGSDNLSSLSVPLAIAEDARVAGALNIYARRPHAFDEHSRAVATGFGSYAAIAAGDLHAYRGAPDTAEGLHAWLATRAVIDRATGILMERHGLTAEQAFRVLVQASMTTHRPLRALADELVHAGQLPAGSRPAAGG